jgi:hypothetical protein
MSLTLGRFVEFPRAPPSGIPQTSLGFRGHLITNFPIMCIRFMFVVIYCALKVIYAISVVLFKYSFVLWPSSQKFWGIVVVIVNFCKFYNICFSCCVKDLSPGKPIFFCSNGNAHALSSRRSRWRDDARKEPWSDTVLFSNNKHFRCNV